MTAARQPGTSIAWRIGLTLAAVVLGVLLVVGLVANRVISGGFEAVLTAQQADQLQVAADTLAADLQAPNGAPARVLLLVRRLATQTSGKIEVARADGTVVAAFGQVPASSAHSETPIEANGTRVGTLVADLPARAPDRGFLRLFNLTLIVAGLVAVAAIALLAAWFASRITRPLRTVAEAAHRLRAGDLSARAEGGADRESAELADAFNAMADRLERSEMLRRRAASDVAHDLATPATVLESQLQAMIDGVVPADREELEAARSAAAALGSVVSQMGELASAESAPIQQRPVTVEVRAAVAEVERALEGLYRERGVTLAVEAAPGLAASALVDPSHLGRALRNVLANAAQHSPRGSVVRVLFAVTPSEIEVRVVDQGSGIAAEDVPHVFERFYRADRARAVDPASGRPSGSGIGLTIARELLVANGGRIAVERTGPEGTTFVIGLPRAA
jgi:two-component system sensor histidine kinase BaeS